MSRLPELPGFRPLAPLGRGGTAEVIRVFSEKHRRQLALKYPRQNESQSSETFARLVQREDHLIGRLTFPGLVRVLEISTDQPQFLLMELCPGPTLEQCGRLDNLALALNVLSAVALSLEFLQANSIIHGDLKPHNIFLPFKWQNLDDDKLFYVKLSDFSLGRFDHEPDSARAGLGTVGYMAPETAEKSRATFQSDLFALGVIAYQLLTGIHPFMDDESDPVKVNSRVREEDPAPLRSLRSDVPEDVVDLAVDVAGVPRLILQQFRPGHCLDPEFDRIQPYPEELLLELAECCRAYVPGAAVRRLSQEIATSTT